MNRTEAAIVTSTRRSIPDPPCKRTAARRTVLFGDRLRKSPLSRREGSVFPVAGLRRRMVGVKRVRVIVTGRVQGVFFRATCAARARSLGLGGWVRNRPDGAVEAAFEGPDADVDAMLTWCRTGTDLSEVGAVEIAEEVPIGEHGFRIV